MESGIFAEFVGIPLVNVYVSMGLMRLNAKSVKCGRRNRNEIAYTIMGFIVNRNNCHKEKVMEKPRIEMLDGDNNVIATFQGDGTRKFRLAYEEYSHGDIDYNTTVSFTIAELLRILYARDEYQKRVVQDEISDWRKKLTTECDKSRNLERQVGSLSQQLERLKLRFADNELQKEQ